MKGEEIMSKMKLTQKREALKGQTQTRGVSVSVSKRDESSEDNTLSFVFVSEDNAGKRFDWGSGEYYDEVLDVNGAVTDRLNTFFKDHSRDVDSAVGRVSNVRVDNGQLLGDITFGSDVNSQEIRNKYAEGILTDVSIGYEIRDYEVKQGAENERDRVTVTDFDVFEVSAVGIGFDSGAKKRENDDNLGSSEMKKELLERLSELEGMVKRTADEQAEMNKLMVQRNADDKAKGETEREALKDENLNLRRQADITAVCATHGVDEAVRTKYMDDSNLTVDALRAEILASKVKPPMSQKASDASVRGEMIDAMVDGLAMRVMGSKIENAHADAEKYRHATLLSIGNQLLPEDKRSFNPSEVAERSLVTGDFPLLLQSVGARVLEAEFASQSGTYKSWIKEVDVPDFRVMTDLTTSIGGGRLDEVLENGDLKELGGKEAGESWKIKSFGNKFILTREMLINDDLGNFTNLLATFGRMAMTTANGEAYDLLQGKGKYTDYKMADGSGIFIVARNNSATDALSSEALSAGRLAMSKHKSIDGETPLQIIPKYLVVGAGLEVKATEILTALNKLGADNTGVQNVNKGLYELIVDHEITSATAWYLLADHRTLKMGYLSGTNRSPATKINESTISRTVYEGVFDLGVMVEDYKGLYRGNV